MKEKRAPNKIENNIKEKKHFFSVDDFINNTHLIIKQHKNIYPKDIRGLFERLGID